MSQQPSEKIADLLRSQEHYRKVVEAPGGLTEGVAEFRRRNARWILDRIDVELRELRGSAPEKKNDYYIVWNEAKTEGFATTDYQLAYEVRKSSESNCYNEVDGSPAPVAVAFCDRWGEENCTIEKIEAPASGTNHQGATPP
jgi:hypothetical protein